MPLIADSFQKLCLIANSCLQRLIHAKIPFMSCCVVCPTKVVRLLLPQLLVLARQQRINRRIQLIPPLQEVQFEDENISHDFAAKCLHQGSSSGCGATCPSLALALHRTARRTYQ